MYFEFSLNKNEYNFKIFIKTNECFEYYYRYSAYNTITKSVQRHLKLDLILKIKYLCDKDYAFEIYNMDELILNIVVNLDVRYMKANYTGL
jgi:hypothetical protein